MSMDKQFEVRMVIFAKDALQAAGKVLIGPNRGNQAFVTDSEDSSGAETAYMLGPSGDPEAIPAAGELPASMLEDGDNT